MAELYSTFPVISHSLREFIDRANALHLHGEDSASFTQFVLSGEYSTDGASKQARIDVTQNVVPEDDDLRIGRDYDSAIGITNDILVDGPITVWAVPHATHALKASIHLKHRIRYRETSHDVPYHQIPNFEFGSFGTRQQIYVLFPKLWNPNLRHHEQPHHVSEARRALWYSSGLRRAIGSLLGDRVASEWPASLQTEKARAMKHRGGPSWSQKVIPKEYVPRLAEAIRAEIASDTSLAADDIEWAQGFLVVHTVRGVKHGHYHAVHPVSAEHFLTGFLHDCQLLPAAPSFGEWWIDVGIEIISSARDCLQWSTLGHRRIVQQALRIPDEDATRITTLTSSKYQRDLASHLTSVSGFRIEPGSQAAGEFEAAYMQAYTTDKAVVYNVEGTHHAKFLTTQEVLSKAHPLETIYRLYDIYQQARDANSSKARLEVRVPWRYATRVLIEFDPVVIRESLYAFKRQDWWDFRLTRMLAISQTLDVQASGELHPRFIPEALLLTAACVWLLNGLHARYDDGAASKELMDAALPIVEASEAYEFQLAYSAAITEDNGRRIAYIPFGCVFFRRMMVDGVPRLRIGGPILPGKSFKFWFNGLNIDQVAAKYQTSGLVSAETVALTRFTTNRQAPAIYTSMTGVPEPNLFHLSDRGIAFNPPVIDTGSDVEDPAEEPDNDEATSIDDEVSQLWRQFVADVTCKSPNPRGSTKASYLKLNDVQRRSGDEAPYKNLRFDELWNAVYYKTATDEEWAGSFKWLFPDIGHQMSRSAQNYGQCLYYKTWMNKLRENQNNPDVIKAIRDTFWDRLRTWSWIPKAEADKMWTTSAAKPSKCNFTRWPYSKKREPAPHILLRSNAVPLFGPEEGEGRLEVARRRNNHHVDGE